MNTIRRWLHPDCVPEADYERLDGLYEDMEGHYEALESHYEDLKGHYEWADQARRTAESRLDRADDRIEALERERDRALQVLREPLSPGDPGDGDPLQAALAHHHLMGVALLELAERMGRTSAPESQGHLRELAELHHRRLTEASELLDGPELAVSLEQMAAQPLGAVT